MCVVEIENVFVSIMIEAFYKPLLLIMCLNYRYRFAFDYYLVRWHNGDLCVIGPSEKLDSDIENGLN